MVADMFLSPTERSVQRCLPDKWTSMTVRQAVIILGMHRSGTSALAGTVSRLGMASPRTPLPTAADNPTGFYESHPVVMTNHQLLLRAGCAWNVCLTFEPDRINEALTPDDRLFISNVLYSEFGDTGSFVLKDPRLCLTLPVWLPALRAMGAIVRVLIVVRDPVEVARSLMVRNRLPEADTTSHWLHHMLEAERLSRGLRRAVVSYGDLVRDWRGCIQEGARIAGVTWPRPIDLAAPDIDAFLTASIRHHARERPSAVAGTAQVCEMINAAWVAFRHLISNPDAPAAQACLDQVRACFAEWRRATFPPGFRAVFPDS